MDWSDFYANGLIASDNVWTQNDRHKMWHNTDVLLTIMYNENIWTTEKYITCNILTLKGLQSLSVLFSYWP